LNGSAGQQLVGLLATGPHLLAAHLLLAAGDGDGRVGRLVRVDTDDHRHRASSEVRRGGTARALLLRYGPAPAATRSLKQAVMIHLVEVID
jgi:hypothetical protein